jgi:hypothetical protein
MRQRDTSAPKVNLDLISQLYKQKVGNEERLAEKKPVRQIGVLDEYDPARPNDYDQVLKQRRKAKSDTTFKNLNGDLSDTKFGKKQAGAPQIILPNFNELAMMGQQQVFFTQTQNLATKFPILIFDEPKNASNRSTIYPTLPKPSKNIFCLSQLEFHEYEPKQCLQHAAFIPNEPMGCFFDYEHWAWGVF